MRPGTLAKSAAAVFVTAGLGGLASRPAESDWYAKLRKPWFQPPRQVFPIVWPILYADIDLTRRAIEARSNRGAPLAAYPLWCAFATLLSTRSGC